mmetsp:Transcript_30619/g.64156  ORF Transcript_30619/g.64156 Transcript_30619/m.64156 type:complete len:92 (+) Transcript_30619:905-1180(+)
MVGYQVEFIFIRVTARKLLAGFMTGNRPTIPCNLYKGTSTSSPFLEAMTKSISFLVPKISTDLPYSRIRHAHGSVYRAKTLEAVKKSFPKM